MTHAIQQNCLLEDLPTLVRYELLRMLDFSDLCALVHASPIFHQQYRQDRKLILRGVLNSTLGSVCTDAHAVYQTSVAAFRDTRNLDNVKRFLKSYSGKRSSKKHLIFNEDEIIAMLVFHASIVSPLIEAYIQWILGNLATAAKSLASANSMPKVADLSKTRVVLSSSENLRIMRGMYRFQLCCNLFGAKGRGCSRDSSEADYDRIDILRIFFPLFEPWEAEEIACVYTFFNYKMTDIFDKISSYVNEKSPIFEGQSIPPWAERDLTHNWARDNIREGTISRGLRLMHTIMFVPKDQTSLLSIMQEELSWPASCFLWCGALDMRAQWDRRMEFPTDRDEKQARRDPLPFNGDGESDENDLRPPLGWAMIWKGTYSNIFGDCVDDNLKIWGYVLWDKDRMEDTGADKVLIHEWGDDTDPRNMTFDDEEEW